MHLLDGYISANQRLIYSTFLNKITKYNRIHWERPRIYKIASQAMILPPDQLVRYGTYTIFSMQYHKQELYLETHNN